MAAKLRQQYDMAQLNASDRVDEVNGQWCKDWTYARSRLCQEQAGEGRRAMSFAEFCYPLVQAWDWWELYQKGVQVQIGGADQFGNILQGAEAVKFAATMDTPHKERLSQEKKIEQLQQPKLEDLLSQDKRAKTATNLPKVTDDPMGFTVPLLTTAAGEKFGKSAGNAVWLDPDLTPPFDLYQFFLRAADVDVERYLKLFTFLPIPDIKTLMIEQSAAPEKRNAQHKLASEFVELIHGQQAAQTAEEQHRQLFSKNLSLGDIQSQSKSAPPLKRQPNFNAIPEDSHPSLNKSAPPQDMHTHASNTCVLPRSLIYQQPLSRILWSAGLVATKSEGNRLILNGGVYIGGAADGKQQMGDQLSYTPADTKKARWEELEKYVIKGEDGDDLLILRTGKWRVKIVRVVSDRVFGERGLSAPGWDEREGAGSRVVEGIGERSVGERKGGPGPWMRRGRINTEREPKHEEQDGTIN